MPHNVITFLVGDVFWIERCQHAEVIRMFSWVSSSTCPTAPYHDKSRRKWLHFNRWAYALCCLSKVGSS